MIELLRIRRSIRKYTQKTIDKKTLDVLLESLLRSPSSRDIKPCNFIIVDNKDMLKMLSNSKEHGSKFLQGAALGIVVCADSTKSDVWIEDASIASILVQMVAESLGLGSCWIQIRNRKHTAGETAEKYIQSLLKIPEHIKILSIISIGYPDEIKKPLAKSGLDYNEIKYNLYSDDAP
ncbi:MAG TPA: NAD(P)H-dependent dehydrogenase/reductase [Deltaproteobacteria bacterium]|nr:NAD(P)H-dependent dehydrogenase/reductase [Deltaproteobacteria bacterium]